MIIVLDYAAVFYMAGFLISLGYGLAQARGGGFLKMYWQALVWPAYLVIRISEDRRRLR